MSTTAPTEPPELTPSAPPRSSDQAGYPGVVLEVLREMREQRNAFERSADLAAKERKSERRWRT